MTESFDPLQDNLQPTVVKFLQEGFLKRGTKKKPEVATEMLIHFFGQYSFDLSSFLQNIHLTTTEKNRFLSYILYEIYYSKNFFSSLHSLPIYDFLWILLAETLENSVFRKKLLQLTPESLLSLIRHSGIQLREGAWLILDLLEQIDLWQPIVHGIKIRYYEPNLLEGLKDPAEALLVLNNHADDQIRGIMKILPRLVSGIVGLPVHGFNIVEDIKKKMDPNYIPDESVKKMRQLCEIFQVEYATTFGKFDIFSYTFEQMQEFFKVFGLWGFFLNCTVIKDHTSPLLNLLQGIVGLVERSNVIPPNDSTVLIGFCRSLCLHLHVFHHQPEKYLNGSKRIVYSLATTKADFIDHAWLPTSLTGLSTLVDYFHSKNLAFASLSDYPIVIFDQNEEKVFQKNRAFIDRLSKSYQAVIWHLSQTQTMALAAKLGLENWIETTPKAFGFGGARNCQFFLAPVINQVIQNGCESWDDLMKLSDQELKAIFEVKVLGKGGQDAILNLGEDDLVTHPSNCFTDALTAELTNQIYFMRFSYSRGRFTMLFSSDLTIASINYLYEELFPFWWESPVEGGMKGILTKPRFCFPLPFGNEEQHVTLPHIWREAFVQPSIHLPGTRYPQKIFPISQLDALAEKITPFFTYTFQILLAALLIDSDKKFRRSITPWNYHPQGMQLFRCLDDLQHYIFTPQTLNDFRKLFWKNFDEIFEENENQHRVKLIVDEYIHQQIPKEFPADLKSFYKRLKLGGEMFMDFGKQLRDYRKNGEVDFIQKAKEAIENKYGEPISENLMVNDLYLMVQFAESFGIKVNLQTC